MEEIKEIDLIDYLDVIWRKKLWIVIPTFLLMLMAGYFSFRTPQVFTADAIIAPGNIMVQTPGGRLEKVQVVNPMQLAIQINQGSYNADIAAALGLAAFEVAGITAENLRDPRGPQYLPATDLILVSKTDMDKEEPQQILRALFELIKTNLDEKIEVEAQNVDSRIELMTSRIKEKEVEILENENQMALTGLEIKDNKQEARVPENEITKKLNAIETKKLEIESVEIDKEHIGAEIGSMRNKIKIVDDYAESLQTEMQDVKARIKEMEGLQKQALTAKKTEAQAISLLLYSNEIQRSLQYSTELDERLRTAKVDREDLMLDIQKKEALIKQRGNQIRQVGAQIATIRADIENNKIQISLIENRSEKIKTRITSIKNANEKIRTGMLSLESEIKLLESQKARISYTELVKAPGPAQVSVGRNPLFMVLIVGFVSFMMFTILAFFIDYIQRHRTKSL
ncbi:MAG: Wzz/FepE/Etk N-terminal domain-containing protein [Candidatus Aminicenantaceae bacterium]